MLVFRVRFKRRGISIIDTLILMIVVGITFGAIFSTMAMAQRSYAVTRQSKDAREILFSFVQTFESLYPGTDAAGKRFVVGDGNYASRAQEESVAAGDILGRYAASEGGGRARMWIGSYYVRTNASGGQNVEATGRVNMQITVYRAEDEPALRNPLIDVTRSFNIWSSDPVSDDAIVEL